MSFYRTTNSTGASCSVNLPITGHVDSKKGDFVWQLNTTNWIYLKSHDFFTIQSVLGPVWVRSIVTYSATWHMRPPKIRRWNFRSLRKVSSGTYLHKKTGIPVGKPKWFEPFLLANCFRNLAKKKWFCNHKKILWTPTSKYHKSSMNDQFNKILNLEREKPKNCLEKSAIFVEIAKVTRIFLAL